MFVYANLSAVKTTNITKDLSKAKRGALQMNINLSEYADFLMKKAVYKCDDLHDAEDLVQETLLAGLVYLKKGKIMDDPAAWLSSVLERKYYDTLRRKYRKPAVSIDFADDIPEQNYLYEDIERSEDAEMIRKNLGQLTSVYRETMVRFYMKDQSIKEIAQALSVPENTVKSRLNAGRKHIRKEIAMEKYTNQSYEPEYLYISCTGSSGNDAEPFSLVRPDDRLAMNLLILAYEKPVTIGELSQAIGIPTPYVEPVIDRLVNGELMKRTGNKVYTDLIIYSKEDREATYELERRYADENYKAVWELMQKGFEELSEQEFYKIQNERQKTKLMAYFAVRTIEHAPRHVRNELTNEFEKNSWESYPDRPNGGKWFAMGNRVTEQEKRHWGSKYSVNGEYGTRQGSVGIYEYGTILHEMNIDMENGILRPLFYAAVNGAFDMDIISKRALDQLDSLIEKGYFIRENGVLKPDIPVISEKDRCEGLYELSDRHAKIIAEHFHDMYMDIYKGKAVKIPPHLDSVPGFLKYLQRCCSIGMMIIMNAKENGLFLNGIDYPTPTAFISIQE